MKASGVRFVGGPMDGKVIKVPGPWQEFVKPQFLVPEIPESSYGMIVYEALVGMGDEEGNLMVRYAGHERR